MKRVYSKTTERVDPETGEITESQKQTTFYVKNRKYCRIYFDNIDLLIGLSGTARNVIDIIILQMEFDSNQIILNKHQKEIMADTLGVSYYTIRNAVSDLVERGILIKRDRTTFYMNPKLFHKGNTTKDQQIERVEE